MKLYCLHRKRKKKKWGPREELQQLFEKLEQMSCNSVIEKHKLTERWLDGM